jgi:hypothetical protein
VLNILKMFNRQKSANYYAKELFNIIQIQKYDKKLWEKLNEYNISMEDFSIYLSSMYLFSYYLATTRNSYNISTNMMEKVSNAFKFYITNDIELSEQENISIILEEKIERYLVLYNQKKINIRQKVVKEIIQELVSIEDKGNNNTDYQCILIFLKELIYGVITIIQDFFISLSVYE